MAIPYLGSKRKSASLIYQTIKNFNPEADTLVDLFCGGFAIGEHFIKNGWTVIGNDKNKYVVALLDQTINKRLDETECLKFVPRERFFDVLKNPDKYDDWYVGYVQCVWSFGNQQNAYMFGKEVEPYKLAGHELVVYKNRKPLEALIPEIPKRYIDQLLQLPDWHTRRIALGRISKKLKSTIRPLGNLTRLQRLEQLERLEQLQQVVFYSDDYQNIPIPDNSIIYCDPPYQGTAEYSEGQFDHNQFWQWARQQSKTHKIYISEYKAPDDFKPILKFTQKSTLQGGHNTRTDHPEEQLFIYNRK